MCTCIRFGACLLNIEPELLLQRSQCGLWSGAVMNQTTHGYLSPTQRKCFSRHHPQYTKLTVPKQCNKSDEQGKLQHMKFSRRWFTITFHELQHFAVTRVSSFKCKSRLIANRTVLRLSQLDPLRKMHTGLFKSTNKLL